jgi:hypothetical protein
MKRFIFLGSVLIAGCYSTTLVALECKEHKIYCAIKTLQPTIDHGFALELSNYIFRYSLRHGTNPYRTVAIIAQESMFRNINTNIDIGIYQINVNTATAYNIDTLRLQEDLEYATEQHILLLKKKKEYCLDLEEEAWTCYHSKTPKHRKAYKIAVDRYYQKIVNLF